MEAIEKVQKEVKGLVSLINMMVDSVASQDAVDQVMRTWVLPSLERVNGQLVDIVAHEKLKQANEQAMRACY